jgi:hypothetical protein
MNTENRKVPRLAFSVAETATALGISTSSVRRLILREKIKPCRLLRHILVPATEIERILSE